MRGKVLVWMGLGGRGLVGEVEQEEFLKKKKRKERHSAAL